MKVVDYDYITEISTEDALKNSASDVTSGYNGGIPGVNTFKINAETSVYNEQGGGTGIAGWSTNVSWSSSDYNTVAWSSGDINLPDGTTLTVTSGNTGNMSSTTYIYYDREDSTVKTTTSASSSVGEDKILLCVAAPTVSGKDAEFQAFGCGDQSTFIHADQIAANTITANEIATNTITATQIASGTITSDTLAVGAVEASNIEDGAVNADKINVNKLSAISANLGNVTAGTITGTTITAGSTSSTAIRLNPNTNSIQIYYGGNIVGEIYGGSNGGYSGVILDSNNVIMIGRDVMDLSGAKLRIPVGDDLY